MEETILENNPENISSTMFSSSSNRTINNKSLEETVHPITLSLFSGAGGLDIGFHKAGFKIVACVELEKVFCQTLQRNVGKYLETDCQVINKDIREVLPEDIAADNIDFIIGGPPCQSFSAIGRRAGGAEGGTWNERGGLFEHYCRLVDHYRPKGFLFENVRGILSSDKGQDWKLIREDFAKLGYRLFYRVLDTAGYGVPQHRERIILVGIKYSLPGFKFPKPTKGPDSLDGKAYFSALEAIADLQDPNEQPRKYNGKYGDLLEEVPPGNNYLYFTKEMGYPEPRFAWRSRFSDFLYKADPNKPVRTIVAQLGAYSGPFHWRNRKFTLEEFKRLQTFPDNYDFAGGLTAALRQIGNSVPPLFAEQLAQAVLQQVFGVDLSLQLIEEEDKLSFDARKGVKASLTRHKRIKIDNKGILRHQTPLFDDPNTIEETTFEEAVSEPKIFAPSERLFHYLSLRSREKIAAPLDINKGAIYQFYSEREASKCVVKVSRYNGVNFSNKPLLKYTVHFHDPIGDGLEAIECTLLSPSDQDIPIVWDAIEDCISSYSNYQTMMDVYGHFTEPHPIFDLAIEILTTHHTFILRFAEKFSHFKATSQVLPGKVLEELWNSSQNEPFDLTTVARNLRDLRFDVRVHETNLTVPPGHFRCCYPFTININKQVSVTWTHRPGVELIMTETEYAEWLSKAYHKAEALGNDPDALSKYKTEAAETLSYPIKTLANSETLFQQTIAEGIETLVGNLRQSKYLFSILITGLAEKLVHPSQDIRYTQAQVYPEGVKGFSNRNTDQYHVTPFLKRHNLTSCAASGAESGRNFERPEPHMLEYRGKCRGKGSKEAYLGILHAIQVEGVDPFPCMVLLMALDIATKQKAIYNYPQPQGLTIEEVVDAVLRHFATAHGNGRARIPVLAIQAVYLCLVPQLSRFKDAVLRDPPNRHTGNDKDGWIGDVQVDNLEEMPFEGVEVKSERKINTDMVRALPDKLQGYPVNRYYILSTETEYLEKAEEKEIQQMVKEVRERTGCEVIVDGFHRSLWYYLRMLEDTDLFVRHYTNQVQTDPDMKDEHRGLWANILSELEG
jgi:DNA (cytosine-5)-methyltransferase 1